MRRRFGLFGAAVVVLVLVYVVAWGTGSGSSTNTASAAAQAAAVTSVTRSCPPPAPNTGKASIVTASAPGTAASSHTATGSATLTSVPSASTAAANAKAAPKTNAKATAKASAQTAQKPITATTPNAAFFTAAPEAAQSGATQVNATGAMAAGLGAEQATANGTGTVSCVHPGADMWFVGTGQDAGASDIWLDLTNTGKMAATVDVTIFTDSGEQDALNDGITVPADQYLSVNLAQYVKGSTALAVQVQTSSGQVAGNVWESGGGSDGAWLPVASSPSTSLVIPGLTAGTAAKLFVAVPGAADAQVKVEAFTAQGKFLPFGSAAQDAPAAAASSFPLNSLGVSAATLVLTSNVPITAGVLVPGNGIGGFTAAAAPISEQGVVAGNPSGGGNTVGLTLAAPSAAARVFVQLLPANPSRSRVPSPRTYTVQAAHTLAVTVAAPKGGSGPFAIVLTPERGSGPLYAARVVVSGGNGLLGQLQSVLPVQSAPTTVQLPPATSSYSAVLP